MLLQLVALNSFLYKCLQMKLLLCYFKFAMLNLFYSEFLLFFGLALSILDGKFFTKLNLLTDPTFAISDLLLNYRES